MLSIHSFLCELLLWLHRNIPSTFSSFQVDILDVFPDWRNILEAEIMNHKLMRSQTDGGINIGMLAQIANTPTKSQFLQFEMSLLQTKTAMDDAMREGTPSHPQHTMVAVTRSEEDPMFYATKLFFMQDYEVLVELRHAVRKK